MHRDKMFGSWLKQRRKALDLTQRALAQRVGCANETIRKIEAGVLRPSRSTAERILQMLEVPASERPTLVQLARIPNRTPPDAPPTTSRPPSSVNLATPLTSLIGRDDDIKVLIGHLLRVDVRLLTLLGPPGIGKTRLSIAVATELQSAFEHGAWNVSLASISDPTLVIPTIARTLGIKESSNQTLNTVLAEYLQSRQLLLVLDNFEQVADAASQVGDLLRATPNLTILVTSRVPLRIHGETQWQVPPLAVPSHTEAIMDGMPQRYAAVELFVQRAQAINPNFRITRANMQAVAELCIRLDGLPLAIELAAARINVLSPSEMLARLLRSPTALHLLTNSPRDTVARQRTLHDAIAWSYDLLGATEQRLLARLSVFAGGWTVAAAEGICEDREVSVGNEFARYPVSVVDGLQSLIEHSLVRHMPGPSDESRFTMLEMIREFASERLSASGEVEIVQQRHAEYFLHFADRIIGGHDPAAFRSATTLDQEMDNFRAVLRWSLSSNPLIGLRIAETLHGRMAPLGMHAEGQRWISALLARVPEPCLERAGALSASAYLALRQGDYGTAATFLAESYALATEWGDTQRAARARLYQGMVAHALGHPEAAMACYQECLALYNHDEGGLAITGILRNIADLAYEQHDLNQARDLYQQTLDLARAQSNTHNAAYAIRGLGHVARRIGDLQHAAALYHESLLMFRSIDDQRCMPFCIEALACIACSSDAIRAARLFGAAQVLRENIGVAIPPAERVDHDAALAVVRATLDPSHFRIAWAEGQVMTLNEAVAYALEQAANGEQPTERG